MNIIAGICPHVASRPRTRTGAAWLFLLWISVPGSAADTITARDLITRMENGRAPFILDVRTAEEFTEGHVPGAVNIPVSDLISRGRELMPFRDKEIVVYCAVGPRAYVAGMLMKQNGFSGVLDLEGHMQHWMANGHPITKPGRSLKTD